MTYNQQGWIPPQQPQQRRSRVQRAQEQQQAQVQHTQPQQYQGPQAQYAQPQQYQRSQAQYAQPQQYQRPQAQYAQPQQYQQPRQQYQQPQYAQPQQYQQYQTQYERPQQERQARQPSASKLGGVGAFLGKRSKVLLVGSVIAVLWFVIVCSSFADLMNAAPVGDEMEQAAYEIGTSIGLMLQMPFLIVAFIGTVFHCLAWLLNKKGFALTAGILFCVALPLGLGNALGYIPCIVLAFVGYSKLKKLQKG